MKQTLTILLCILFMNVFSQRTSREWLNLRGNVKSVRQMKYNFSNDSLIMEDSDHRRFGDIAFMSIGQQLFIDNSYIEFAEDGKIIKWNEFGNNDKISNELKLFYSENLLPFKIEIFEGQDIALQINYQFDKIGNFKSVEIKGVSSSITRGENLSVISETITSGKNQTTFKYNYISDGTVQIQMYDGQNLINSMDNKFNDKLDFIFDGRYDYKYEYDTYGNWTKKTGYRDNIPSIVYKREIKYY